MSLVCNPSCIPLCEQIKGKAGIQISYVSSKERMQLAVSWELWFLICNWCHCLYEYNIINIDCGFELVSICNWASENQPFERKNWQFFVCSILYYCHKIFITTAEFIINGLSCAAYGSGIIHAFIMEDIISNKLIFLYLKTGTVNIIP